MATETESSVQKARDRVGAEVEALGVNPVVVMYTIVSAGFVLGTDGIDFIDIPFGPDVLAGLLVLVAILDRFVVKSQIPRIVYAYTGFTGLFAGAQLGFVNMAFPPRMIGGILLLIFLVDRFTKDSVEVAE